VLAIYVANGDTPYGYGLIKVDKDSKLLWSVPERTHHDIWVDEEGTIYALGHEILDELPPGLNFIKTPYIDDYILIISPDGKVLDRIRILEALYNSDYRNELFKVALGYQYGGDFLHINTVRTIPARLEGKLPFLKKGLITTSSKHMSFVGLVDPKERKMVWLDRGVGLFQHDPEFTDDGTVMIFDNYGEYAKTSRSRVVEYDPVDRTIVWQWNGDGKTALYSDMRSTKQILPNGNILVTESDGGRLLEVTRDKKVVWEYVNPERMTLDGVTKIAVLSGAKRYLPEDLTFLGGTSKAR